MQIGQRNTVSFTVSSCAFLIRSRTGSVIYVKQVAQHIVIVNSAEAAMELFEKRSQIYSDRPYVPMINL